MKISIGSRIIDGPWGGGNLFVKNMSNYLTNLGHTVVYDLSDSDIDLILLTDPRSRKESSSTFNHIDIQKYKKFVNRDVVVVQRINECDERKGTNFINNFYLEASNCADHVVFVSSWLRDIYLKLGLSKNKSSVILAGANKTIFNQENSNYWNKNEPIKLVTHHWSNHINKGFKLYDRLDKLLNNKPWIDKLEFTYIGNFNEDFQFLNSTILPPLAGEELANELKKHHIYVTASINEPSGNHHIEAAQCGLPILYLNSGGIPEYCQNYGIAFDEDFEYRLEELIQEYDNFKAKIKNYKLNSEIMCDNFYALFLNLLKKHHEDREQIRVSLRGNFFIFKNKFLKLFRDTIYFNFKAKLINLAKRAR